MKRICILLSLAMLPILAMAQNQQDRLKQHVYTLAADSLRGREAGSHDALRAAQYITQQFQKIGIKPLYQDYMQLFEAYFGNGRNVIGVIEGNDPVLKHEFIVIGAHYDHLGIRNDNTVYNGADDNASGTAAVIELARNLQARQSELKRSVIFICFDGEEKGLWGSKSFVEKLSSANDADNDASILYNANDVNTFLPIEKIKLMMSLDMVGWLKKGKTLQVAGTGMLRHSDDLLQGIATKSNFPLKTKDLDNFPFGSTDSEPFARAGVPAFYVTTGLKSPYHKPEDDANLIDYVGLDSITTFLTEATVAFANAENLDATGRVATKHRSKLPIFEGGVSLGFNRNYLNFPDAGFTTHSLLGYQGGLMARFNIKHVAIQLEAYYNQSRCKLPRMEGNYDSTSTFSQGAITIPLSVQLQLNNPSTDLFFGVGGYYSRLLNTRIDKTYIQNHPQLNWETTPNQWGLQWNFGFRFSKVLINVTSLYQLNKSFATELPENPVQTTSIPGPKACNSTFLCTFTYLL